MKHAGPAALERLEPLLGSLRQVAGLREKRSGTFYLRSKAFLHFHEDHADLYVDVRFDKDFERLRVTTKAEQAAVVRRVRATLTVK